MCVCVCVAVWLCGCVAVCVCVCVCAWARAFRAQRPTRFWYNYFSMRPVLRSPSKFSVADRGDWTQDPDLLGRELAGEGPYPGRASLASCRCIFSTSWHISHLWHLSIFSTFGIFGSSMAYFVSSASSVLLVLLVAGIFSTPRDAASFACSAPPLTLSLHYMCVPLPPLVSSLPPLICMFRFPLLFVIFTYIVILHRVSYSGVEDRRRCTRKLGTVCKTSNSNSNNSNSNSNSSSSSNDSCSGGVQRFERGCVSSGWSCGNTAGQCTPLRVYLHATAVVSRFVDLSDYVIVG